MDTITIDTVVSDDGEVRIGNLPAGERLRIIVLSAALPVQDAKHPFWGTPLRLDDPVGPLIPIEDWEDSIDHP